MFPWVQGGTARRLLVGSRFADVRWVQDTGSTNADIGALARAGAPDGVVVVAEHQRGGRGRLGRTWTAPPGSSLLCSMLLRPHLALPWAHLLTNALGVAVAEACRAVSGVPVGIKWPNDLVVGDRKLGGILAESVSVGDRLTAVVVGLGLNVSWPIPADLPGGGPGDLGATATALNHEAGRELDRELLLVAILERFERIDPMSVTLAGRYRSLSVTLGRRVRVDLGPPAGPTGATVEGTAVDVDRQGQLVVETDAGGRRSFMVGDVVHLRPAHP